MLLFGPNPGRRGVVRTTSRTWSRALGQQVYTIRQGSLQMWVIPPPPTDATHVRLQLTVGRGRGTMLVLGSVLPRLDAFARRDDRVYLADPSRSIDDTLRAPNDGGTWYVRVCATSGDTGTTLSYRIWIEYLREELRPPLPTPTRRFALVIGVSDYAEKGVTDLQFCDEDATSWCTFLASRGYATRLLGDGTSSYGRFTPVEVATEANVRRHVTELVALCRPGDQLVVATSGHGSGDGRGNSCLYCVDANDSGGNGLYTDREFSQDLLPAVQKGVRLICCFDNCMSGGMLDDLRRLGGSTVCGVATCTDRGYGYDMQSYRHGAWTYCFLVRTLMANGASATMTVTEAFASALRDYPFGGADRPMLVGNGRLTF